MRDVRVLVREDCVRETVVDVPVAGLVSADCIEVSREQKERERETDVGGKERKEGENTRKNNIAKRGALRQFPVVNGDLWRRNVRSPAGVDLVLSGV